MSAAEQETASSPEQLTPRAITIIILGAAIVLMTTGTRQSFGLFLGPVSDSLDTGRETFSLAIALQNLVIGLPIVAMMADRMGPRRIVMGSGLLLATGLLMAAAVNGPLGLFLTFPPVIGVAISGASFVVVLGAVGREVPESRRTAAFGLITAAGSFGMFLLTPFSQFILDQFGWREAFLTLSALTALIAVAGWFLPRDEPGGQVRERGAESSLVAMLHRARKNRSYLLLTTGFFVCGFHVSFIAVHLKPYLTDGGLDGQVGAWALSLIGLFNILGALAFGALGDRRKKRTLLSLLYLGRSVAISLLLILPLTTASALVFGAVIGVLWLATVPLTSSIVDGIFGPRYLSTLFGVVFMSHQVGAFLGAWLGGRVFDATGSYDRVWVIAIVLGLLAALIHLPISSSRDKGLPEPEQRSA